MSTDESFQPTPPAPLPPPIEPAEIPTPSVAVDNSGTRSYFAPTLFFLAIVLLVMYVTPLVVHHWRVSEANAEAEVVYQKRRAELKAEAEHADQRLVMLDQKIQFASLGFREVVRKVAPAVVNVQNLILPVGKKADLAGGPFTEVFDPETGKKYLQAGLGSGVLIEKGRILTNHHVVEGAHRLRVTFATGQSIGLDPSAVRADSFTDLAVLILPNDLPAALQNDAQAKLAFANSDKDVQVGDFALAIGSPLGLKQTVSQGVISAKGRLLNRPLVELLQTDAAIHPGSSGGPLFDQVGRIVGINVAIASDNGRNQGIGFAIPSNTAKRIFEKLSEQGEVARGYLGVALQDLEGPRAKQVGFEDGGLAIVSEVIADQPAAQAGLKEGDVILRYQGEALAFVQPVRHLRQLIADTEPGAKAELEISRSGQRQRIAVTVGKRPALIP